VNRPHHFYQGRSDAPPQPAAAIVVVAADEVAPPRPARAPVLAAAAIAITFAFVPLATATVGPPHDGHPRPTQPLTPSTRPNLDETLRVAVPVVGPPQDEQPRPTPLRAYARPDQTETRRVVPAAGDAYTFEGDAGIRYPAAFDVRELHRGFLGHPDLMPLEPITVTTASYQKSGHLSISYEATANDEVRLRAKRTQGAAGTGRSVAGRSTVTITGPVDDA